MALLKNRNSTYRELQGMSCRVMITGRNKKFCQYEKLLKKTFIEITTSEKN